jgi:hypothetical protein
MPQPKKAPIRRGAGARPRGMREVPTVELPPLRVRPGASGVRVTIAPPAGHVFDPSVPFELHAKASGCVDLDPSSLHFVSPEPRFPHVIPARFHVGKGKIDFDLVVYYCDDAEARYCCYQHVRLRLGIEVDTGYEETGAAIEYRLGLPEVAPA